MLWRNKPAQVRLPEAIEQADGLDGVVDALRPVADRLVADPGREAALHGRWLGHALHPVLTDFPLGMWTSATVLDLIGGPQARPAARKLVGLGVLGALPTALTGLAEWATTGRREQRVGVVHAAANTAALGLYAASWWARRHPGHGTKRAMAGGAVAAAGGYLGGHLTEVRDVSSRHPAFS